MDTFIVNKSGKGRACINRRPYKVLKCSDQLHKLWLVGERMTGPQSFDLLLNAYRSLPKCQDILFLLFL